ncbi:M48 family metalloprotease [Spirosoma areae]
MKNITLVTSVVAICSILVTGCKESMIDSGLTPGNSSATQSARLSADLENKLAQLFSSLPLGTGNSLQQNPDLLLKTHPEYRDLVQRVVNITPTACNSNTEINQWLSGQLTDWNRTLRTYVSNTAMLDLPTYDALVFENSSANQYFGVNGEYTHRLTKTFKDLQRFWNIQSSDMVLAAMHGSMLRDRSKLLRTYTVVYGLSAADAAFFADFVLALLDAFPQLRQGNHPVFTFNAFALQGFSFPLVGKIPDKIIMGDGILEGFTAIGYDDVAPQAILAHEFGHQIQFQLDLFEDETSPEATRRTELMADAYSAYYLSHARGASMQWKRVQQFFQVFFNIGDCGFTSDGHHGTPTQRLAAAQWGYSVANNAQKQGHILTAQQFTALFEAQLPELIAH